MELDEDPHVPEAPDDRYEVRRFATEVELFQSWAALEASRRKTLAWEWAAWAGALILGYLILVFVGQKHITWLDIGSGCLLLITTVGIISYELVCARAFGKVADPDAAGGAVPEGSPVETSSASGGSPALGKL
jgi:hypothetical protein